MTATGRVIVMLTVASGLIGAVDASAQVLGTFRWQLAPSCNVVTLRVEQKGTVYELSGTDDECGATTQTAVNGSAYLNPNGSISMGFTSVRPDGFSIATNVSLTNLAMLSGTWADEWGNSGTFTFSPPSPAPGTVRRITLRGDYAIIYPATAANSDGSQGIAFGRTLPSAPQAPAANIIPIGGAPTANCPGNVTNPQAAPGHMCVYERQRINVASLQVFNAGTGIVGNPNNSGASLYVRSTAAGNVYSYGRWAVTIP
jgi:hypothetical protein